MVGNGGGITGVFGLPQCAAMRKLHGDIVFMDYQNTRLSEKCRREQLEYFKKAAEELMDLRRSGHLPMIDLWLKKRSASKLQFEGTHRSALVQRYVKKHPTLGLSVNQQAISLVGLWPL